MKNATNQQGGFTLIELIVVIVILGILSVVALPRMVNLSDEAVNSTVQGAFGAVQSANAMVHGAYLVTGNPSLATVDAEGRSIALQSGYPAADVIDSDGDITTDGILVAAGINGEDYIAVTDSPTAPTRVSVTAGRATSGSSCFTFTEATSGNQPSINLGSWTDAGDAGVFEDGECS